MSDLHNKVILGDCLEILPTLPEESVDLVFADPPFNIGLKYDTYDDNRPIKEYLNWTHQWISQVFRVMKPTGSLFIAVGDEVAGDVRVILRDFKLHFRNWIIWHYTFGQHTKKKFSRAHTHILYFVKNPKNFTFNADAIRVPSARQLVYNDKRANPKGRIPYDVWTFSRVCGTFKERVGNHPCQMPLALLERIIRAASNPGEVILDPFAGTGTTLAAAAKLMRKYIGIEISEQYYQTIQERMHRLAQSKDNNLFSLFEKE